MAHGSKLIIHHKFDAEEFLKAVEIHKVGCYRDILHYAHRCFYCILLTVSKSELERPKVCRRPKSLQCACFCHTLSKAIMYS